VSTPSHPSPHDQDIALDADGTPINSVERSMEFLDHLEVLRWTLVKCVIAFALMAGLVARFLGEFNHVLLWPLHHVQAENPKLVLDLGTTSIMEGFDVTIQLCAFGGLVMAAPFILIFIGQFVSPALSAKEARMALPVGLGALVLLLLGGAFGFFLLVPSTIRVSLELNELLGFSLRWTPNSYYTLLVWLVLGVGIAFEFPLLIVLAIHLGFLRVETLRKYRRHAIVAIFLIAAIVTPTPDPITQSMFAAPLYLLYELAIFAGAWVQKRRDASLA
jgi:sec-independent protein translocase protein TatC